MKTGIMKKGIKLCLVGIILILIGLILRAGVQERNISMKQFKFNIPSGSRIIVIEPPYTKTYIRITPPEARKFNYKVPEGKTLSGVLTLK